jgi:PKD repeat protein
MTVYIKDRHGKTFDTFTINKKPRADFGYKNYSENFDVSFTSKSIGNIYKYDWDFGDGSPHSKEKNPTHTYAKMGQYPVTLKVSSAFNTSEKSKTVQAGSVKADFSADKTEGDIGLKVRFSNKSRGNISSYQWEFGDGATSSEENPTHQYAKNGKFNVKLTVKGEGASNSKTKKEYIKVIPFADFTPDPEHCMLRTPVCRWAGCTIKFSNKSKGDSLKYSWDFGDGKTSDEESPKHDYAINHQGMYTRQATLTITSKDGRTDRQKKTVTVECTEHIIN